MGDYLIIMHDSHCLFRFCYLAKNLRIIPVHFTTRTVLISEFRLKFSFYNCPAQLLIYILILFSINFWWNTISSKTFVSVYLYKSSSQGVCKTNEICHYEVHTHKLVDNSKYMTISKVTFWSTTHQYDYHSHIFVGIHNPLLGITYYIHSENVWSMLSLISYSIAL